MCLHHVCLHHVCLHNGIGAKISVTNHTSDCPIKIHTHHQYPLDLSLFDPMAFNHNKGFHLACSLLNPSNAEATSAQSTMTQRFLKTSETLSCMYSLDSSRRVLSDEYPFARVSVISQVFLHHFVLVKLATSSTRVKSTYMV